MPTSGWRWPHDHPTLKKARNAALFDAVQDGARMIDLARLHGLTKARVSQIIEEERRRRENPAVGGLSPERRCRATLKASKPPRA